MFLLRLINLKTVFVCLKHQVKRPLFHLFFIKIFLNKMINSNIKLINTTIDNKQYSTNENNAFEANKLTGLGVEKLLILNAVKSKEPESSIDLGKGEYLSCDIIMNRQNIDDLIKHPFFVKNYLESESLYNTLNNVFYFEGMT